MVTVVFVLAPGVHLLDLAGPAQAFGTVGEITGQPWNLRYVADTPTVVSHQGVPLGASTEWPALTAADLVVVPGWQTAGQPGRQPLSGRLLGQIAGHHTAGGEVMSVCAGALTLAATGILDGRRATTHHEIQDRLAAQHPRVHVVRDVLYVSADRIHTSAGIASGIDLALHLIAQRLGPRVASRVARTMVVYARRNGTAPQDSVMLRHRDHLEDLVHRAQDLIDEDYAKQLRLDALAAKLAVSERTLTRAFARAVGLTPLRYQQSLRLEQAELMIAAGATMEAAARNVGFEDARMLRRLRQAKLAVAAWG